MSAALRSAVLQRLLWPSGRCRLAFGTCAGPQYSPQRSAGNTKDIDKPLYHLRGNVRATRRRVYREAQQQAEPGLHAKPGSLSTNSIARAVVSRVGEPSHGSPSPDQSADQAMDDQTLLEALSQTSAGTPPSTLEPTPDDAEYVPGDRREHGRSLRSSLKRLKAAVQWSGDRDFEKMHASARGPIKNLSFTLAWFKATKGLYAPNPKFDTPPEPNMLVSSFNEFMADVNKKLAGAFGTETLPEDMMVRYRLKSVLPENHTPPQFKSWPVLRIKFSAPLMRVKVVTRGRGPTLADAATAAVAGLHVDDDVRQLMKNVNLAQAVILETPPPYGLLRRVYSSAILAGDFPHVKMYQEQKGSVLRVTKQKCRSERPTKIAIEAPRLGIKVEADEYIEKACRAFLEALESRAKSGVQAPPAPSSFGSVTPENARGILELRHPGCVFSFAMPRDLYQRRMGVQEVQCTRNSIPFGPSVLVTLPPLGKWKGANPATQKLAQDAAELAYMAAAMYPFQGKAPIGIPSFRGQRRLDLSDLDGEPEGMADEQTADEHTADGQTAVAPAWPNPTGIDLSKPKVW